MAVASESLTIILGVNNLTILFLLTIECGKFSGIAHPFSSVIDHQEKRLFYNLQPFIYNVNQILIQVVSGFRKWVVNRVGISRLFLLFLIRLLNIDIVCKLKKSPSTKKGFQFPETLCGIGGSYWVRTSDPLLVRKFF